jgi:hypothetical protein
MSQGKLLVVSGFVDADRKNDAETFLEPARNRNDQRRRLTGPSPRRLAQSCRQKRSHLVHPLNLHAARLRTPVGRASAERPLRVRSPSAETVRASPRTCFLNSAGVRNLFRWESPDVAAITTH